MKRASQRIVAGVIWTGRGERWTATVGRMRLRVDASESVAMPASRGAWVASTRLPGGWSASQSYASLQRAMRAAVELAELVDSARWWSDK